MIDYQQIKACVKEILPEIVAIRREIHMNPEIALKEFKTSARVRRELENLNVSLRPPFLETDVVGLMKGMASPTLDEKEGTSGETQNPTVPKKKEKNITLRADMDALPLREKTGLSYASKIDGMMHACGHDGHTAILIGTAMVLDRLREQFQGSVRFVFQPGEEEVAAGRDLVEKGALLDPVPDAVYALHGRSTAPLGSIGAIEGIASSATDFFEISIHGKGAHGARPDKGNNPILIGSKLVSLFQEIPSNRFSPFESVVVTTCEFSSGHNANVIPDTAVIKGTVRSFSEKNSDRVKEIITKIVDHLCRASDAAYDIIYRQAYIPIINAGNAVSEGKRVTQEILGLEWIDERHPSMGGEDFSFYLVDYPGAMFTLGLGKDRALGHHPEFDFNDDAIQHGIFFFVVMVMEGLKC